METSHLAHLENIFVVCGGDAGRRIGRGKEDGVGRGKAKPPNRVTHVCRERCRRLVLFPFGHVFIEHLLVAEDVVIRRGVINEKLVRDEDVVGHVLSDRRIVDDGWDTERCEDIPIANSGELQKGRSVECASGDHDLAGGSEECGSYWEKK